MDEIRWVCQCGVSNHPVNIRCQRCGFQPADPLRDLLPPPITTPPKHRPQED